MEQMILFLFPFIYIHHYLYSDYYKNKREDRMKSYRSVVDSSLLI